MRIILLVAAALAALPAVAAERSFNFSDYPPDQTPPGFRSTVAGRGKPGEWKVILDEVPPALAPLTAKAPDVARRAVLAQTSRQPAANHFSLLIFEGETYGDFNLTTRFKITGGALEQVAGVVFHFQNESNFYAVFADTQRNRFQCFKVAQGELKQPLGPEMEISKGVWHTLTAQCEGTRIICSLDGKDAIKLVDNASAGQPGKIGFWTKSDTVGCFADTKITYTTRELPAQKLVRSAFEEFPRLLGLAVYAIRTGEKTPVIIASKNEKEIGQTGGTTEMDVINHGTSYFSKDKQSVSITAPLRDRNGDPIAAVRVVMKSFPGQTEQNAAVRAQPVVRKMQAEVQSLDDLLK
jgi:hypothetical protein